ncbi:MAG: Transcriptional regulator, AraC family [Bradyrhizobium sp.]|nr:Transcriptional regulator, AraC family [Bradyrhizobium sp.]MEA2867505.1 AraC family transcriptional regulator [Bradyrhizobium sp.]
MTRALSIVRGRFGRVALLDMDTSLVDHAHPHYHLIFKASGPDQNFVVEGQTVPLRSDTLVAVNSWQQHEYVHRHGAERTLFLALYIEPAWLADADRTFAGCSEPGFFPRAGIAITNEIDRLRAGVVRRMADPSDPHELQELILDLCLTVSYGFSDWRDRSARLRTPRGSRDYRISRALRHIRDSSAEAVDLDDVANISGLSRPHFNHLFRECTGVSPRVYVNALRVETAVGRLRQHQDEIGSISEDLGFSAQSNFTRFFQQHTGTSPNQYRRVMADLG